MNKTYETKLGDLSPEARALPFSPMLPEDPIGLRRWRLYVRQRCLEDRSFRELIMEMCALDVVFFVQTFGVWHETRTTEKAFGKFAVMLDPDQKDILAWWQEHVGKTDITVEKTRGIGLSYLIISFCLWCWRFRGEGIELGLLSKDDFSLDLPGRPSSLMGKMDLMWANMPEWMKRDSRGDKILRRTAQHHRFENLMNGNSVFGYTASDEKLRSARLFCLFVDEAAFLPMDIQRWLAAAHGTTPSIVYVSTHNGTASMFYKMTRDAESDLVRIATFWWDNIRCAAGMYRSVGGEIDFLDLEYVHKPDYEFSHDHPGYRRSPWVDRAFRRAGANSQAIFEELYGIAAVMTRKLFNPHLMTRVRATCTRELYRGGIDENGFYEDDLNGELYLWVSPENLTGSFYIGIDPAVGTKGGAFAGLVAWDVRSGVQVASACLRNCPPVEFARFAVEVAKMLAGPRGPGFARIAYESTGIGVSFGNELQRLRWPAVSHAEGKKTPGFHNPDRGESWMVELGRALMDGEAAIRDERIANEMDDFEYDQQFELQYAGAEGHGDLVVAAAVGWQAAKAHRRALVKAARPSYNNKASVESEPLLQERKQQGQVWSQRWR